MGAICLSTGRIGLGWAHEAIYFACHMSMHSPCIRTPFFFFFFNILAIFELFGAFLIVSLSLPLLLFTLVVSMAPKRKSVPSRNPLHSGTSSSSHIRFRDENARKNFLENFSRRGVHSECRVILANFADTDLPTVIHSQGWESLCDVLVTCLTVLIQEFYSNMHGFDSSVPLFSTRIWGTRICVTSQHIAEVLHVPRLEHPDYPSCVHLRTVSKDEMIFAFYERPTDWGDHQFTPCKAFAKGPKFINMVMIFVLHPLSYYNSITEHRARFLLSLLEHFTIDFPSHFILSIIDVHQDSATCDKFIFPLAITRILRHFFVPFPLFDHFHVMGAIDAATVKRSKA